MHAHARYEGTISGSRCCARRFRFCATTAACRTSWRATNTISSSRKVTSKVPTGSFRWICCAVSSKATLPRSSDVRRCTATNESERFGTRDRRRTVEPTRRAHARNPWRLQRRRERRNRSRAAAGRVSHSRLPPVAVVAGRLAGGGDGDGARPDRRLERRRTTRRRLPPGRPRGTRRAISAQRSLLRRAGRHRTFGYGSRQGVLAASRRLSR